MSRQAPGAVRLSRHPFERIAGRSHAIARTNGLGPPELIKNLVEDYMPTAHSISTLLTRNLHDVFGENDPPCRRAAIDEIFTEDSVFAEVRSPQHRWARRGA